MSAKISKSATATKKTASKVPVQKVAKTDTVRLSEEDKKADTENYVLNPNTGKYVKKDSPNGKKLVKAEETGEEIPKMMTETQRLILVVQTLADQLGLEDSAIKASLKIIESELPRGFPNGWGGKQKTARHPDHPKQPSNPYIFYTKAVRPSVVLANPDAKNTEIVSIMSKQWKETAEEDREEYNEQAASDKVRYEEEMNVFETEHPELARAKTSPPNNGKPTKETAYHLWCEENRELYRNDNLDLDGKAITKLLAERWEMLKKDDKKRVAEYQAIADEANKGFEERVIEYHTSPNTSPKKLSKAEQVKADDPEHYELSMKTGRYVRKEGPKKEASPKKKTAAKKERPAKKAATEKIEKLVKKEEEEVNEDDELLVE
jgi:hypothetical protein